MRLSILIPSTPSRWDMTARLIRHLEDRIGDRDIEVLTFFDNKKRSIGAKREALKNISQGKYWLFCDSDDWLIDVEAIYDATEHDVDVITFDAKCWNSDGSTYIVNQALGNPIEHNNDGNGRYLDMKRPPFQNCAWSSKFKKHSFPDISYSEDAEFLKKCWLEAKTEIHIDQVIFEYRFNENITEASTESNEYWKNPNESHS